MKKSLNKKVVSNKWTIMNFKKNKNQTKNTKDGIKAEDFLRRKK